MQKVLPIMRKQRTGIIVNVAQLQDALDFL